MVQTLPKITLEEFLKRPETAQMGWLIDPDEETVFVYYPNQPLEVLDKPDRLLPVPSFASQLKLTVKDLFDLLLD